MSDTLSTFELVDTHCHLDFNAFDSDRNSVLERAIDNGLIRILIPSINIKSTRAALKIAADSDFVYVAVGVHPNDALSWGEETISELKLLAKQPKVVAIGEIGLDYYRDYAPRELQKKIFEEQLFLAAEMDLPIIVHNRESTTELLQILNTWHSSLVLQGSPLAYRPGVLHSFSGDVNDATVAQSMNFYIGITGPVTFRKADELCHVVSTLSLDRLLIETDAPFLTPHPYRGKRNEPSYVKYVAAKIAEIRGISIPKIASITTQNAEKLFNW